MNVPHWNRKKVPKRKRVKSAKNLEQCKEIDDYKCRICGSTDNVSAHHIINRSLGGDDRLSNLITVCFNCHRWIHDGKLDFRDFLRKLNESHPPLSWFRWEEALEELNKRK